MRFGSILLRMITIISFISTTHGLIHFYSEAGDRHCFYKELTQGSLLIGKFKLEIKDEESSIYYSPRDKNNIGVLIDVEETFDSNHRVVHQRGTANGQFTFIPLDTGEHRLCLTPKSFYSRTWYGKKKPYSDINEFTIIDSKFKSSRISIDLLIADSSIIDSRRTNEVQSLSKQINKLNDKLTDIKREQKFIREKEAVFRDLSERTCETVVRWMIIQVTVILLACLYQIFSLSHFFVKIKIA
ncbi:emp24/gp25L/p24 family of membrane trafficking protein [Scheffersomyces amazonensis]|uniref:emp24/gp25L/p24 family of membrane trafficking protein n=1 Tax=Scheffersomyces amazonensis TaxID=1078765 RepID=UPI00315CBF5C